MALLFQLTQKLALGFQALWARYPNKSAKKDAEKAYGQVVKTPEIDAEVHGALDWQIPHWETMEWYHPPYLATYLRQERFRDEKPKTINRTTAKVVPLMAQQQVDAASRIKSLIATGMDPEEAKQTVYREIGWIREDQS